MCSRSCYHTVIKLMLFLNGHSARTSSHMMNTVSIGNKALVSVIVVFFKHIGFCCAAIKAGIGEYALFDMRGVFGYYTVSVVMIKLGNRVSLGYYGITRSASNITRISLLRAGCYLGGLVNMIAVTTSTTQL